MSGNVGVQAAIAERLAVLRIEANEVLYRVDQRARASADDFLTFETVQRQAKVWVPVAVAIAEKQIEVDVERETNARVGTDRETDDALAKLERELVRLEVLQEREPGRLVQIDGPVTEAEVFRFDLARMRDAGKLHLVKAVTETKEGVKVELHSSEHADDVLAKHLGIVGPTGSKDDPHHVAVTPIELRIVNAPRSPQRPATRPPDDAG